MKKVHRNLIKTLEIIGTALIIFGLSINDRVSASPDTALAVTLILLAFGFGCFWLTFKI